MDTFYADDFDLTDDCLDGFAAQDYQARMICSESSLQATINSGNAFIAPGWLHDLESMEAGSLDGSQASRYLMNADHSFNNNSTSYREPALAHTNNDKILADDNDSLFRTNHQNQAHHNNALSSWYHDIDAPWIPKVLSDTSLQTPSQILGSTADVYLSTPANQQDIDVVTKLGSLSSDSGYETRKSLYDASIFSYEIVDHDDRLFMEHLEAQEETGKSHYSQLQGDTRIIEQTQMTGMTCSTCHKECRTPSELRCV